MPLTLDDTACLSAQVKAGEGLRLEAYRCPAGALTVGYGHNCDASPVAGVSRTGDSITRERAENLFESDLSVAVWTTRKALPWIINLRPARQAVLYDMAFNMGLGSPGGSRGLLSFRNTLKMTENGDYAGASRRMLQSKWARQVKSRAVKLARQMETGEWQ